MAEWLARARALAPARPVPANDEAQTVATPEEEAELRELVAIVADDWPDADRAEALTVALADPEAALTCWRALAVKQCLALDPLERDPGDDRQPCEQCTHLDRYRGRDGFRRCAAARRGELPYVASRDYSPVPDVPRRCEGYAPTPDDLDRRTGRERWPGLIQTNGGVNG